MRKRGWISLGGVLVAATTVAVWWAVGDPTDAPLEASAQVWATAPPNDAPARPEVPAVARVSRVGSIQPGTYSARYAFALEAQGGRERVEITVEGALDLGPGRDGGTPWHPARLRNARVTLNDAAREVVSVDTDPNAIKRPWLVRVEPDGRVSDVRFSPGLSFATRAVLAGMAYHAQLAAPPQPDASTWEREERDMNGSYVAHYTREADGAVVRRWQGDDKRAGQTSVTTVRFAQDGERVTAVSVDQQGGIMSGTSLDPKTFSPFSVALTLRWLGPVDVSWGDRLDPERLASFSAADAPDRDLPEAPARPYATVLAEVSAGASQTDPAGRYQHLVDLTAAVAADSRAPAALEQTLRARTLDERAETVAIAALVGAATDEAQAAVGRLVEDESADGALRGRVLQSVTFLQTPNTALLATLLGQAQSAPDPLFAAAAGTVLGAMSSSLAQTRPVDSQALAEALVMQAKPALELAGAHTSVAGPPAVRMAWLSALGNVQDPVVLPLVLDVLRHDPNPLVRGSAAFALRLQSAANCLDTMIFAMTTDPSIHVRDKLMEAAQVMGPDKTLAMVQRALVLDESPSVRLSAAYTIATWAATAPGLRTVLASAVKSERDEKVVEALKNYLEPGRMADPVAAEPARMGEMK